MKGWTVKENKRKQRKKENKVKKKGKQSEEKQKKLEIRKEEGNRSKRYSG